MTSSFTTSMSPAIAAVSLAPAGSRQAAITRCPSFAYCRANSRPNPLSQPVTSTVAIFQTGPCKRLIQADRSPIPGRTFQACGHKGKPRDTIVDGRSKLWRAGGRITAAREHHVGKAAIEIGDRLLQPLWMTGTHQAR